MATFAAPERPNWLRQVACRVHETVMKPLRCAESRVLATKFKCELVMLCYGHWQEVALSGIGRPQLPPLSVAFANGQVLSTLYPQVAAHPFESGANVYCGLPDVPGKLTYDRAGLVNCVGRREAEGVYAAAQSEAGLVQTENADAPVSGVSPNISDECTVNVLIGVSCSSMQTRRTASEWRPPSSGGCGSARRLARGGSTAGSFCRGCCLAESCRGCLRGGGGRRVGARGAHSCRSLCKGADVGVASGCTTSGRCGCDVQSAVVHSDARYWRSLVPNGGASCGSRASVGRQFGGAAWRLVEQRCGATHKSSGGATPNLSGSVDKPETTELQSWATREFAGMSAEWACGGVGGRASAGEAWDGRALHNRPDVAGVSIDHLSGSSRVDSNAQSGGPAGVVLCGGNGLGSARGALDDTVDGMTVPRGRKLCCDQITHECQQCGEGMMGEVTVPRGQKLCCDPISHEHQTGRETIGGLRQSPPPEQSVTAKNHPGYTGANRNSLPESLHSHYHANACRGEEPHGPPQADAKDPIYHDVQGDWQAACGPPVHPPLDDETDFGPFENGNIVDDEQQQRQRPSLEFSSQQQPPRRLFEQSTQTNSGRFGPDGLGLDSFPCQPSGIQLRKKNADGTSSRATLITPFLGDDSEEEDIDEWLEDMEFDLVVLGVPPHEFALKAFSCLEGTARLCVKNLIRRQGSYRMLTDWQLMRSELRGLFYNPMSPSLHRAKLSKMRQNVGQSVKSFAARVERTGLLAYPRDQFYELTRDHLIRDHLCSGLLPDLGWHMMAVKKHDTSFGELVERATTVESNIRLTKLWQDLDGAPSPDNQLLSQQCGDASWAPDVPLPQQSERLRECGLVEMEEREGQVAQTDPPSAASISPPLVIPDPALSERNARALKEYQRKAQELHEEVSQRSSIQGGCRPSQGGSYREASSTRANACFRCGMEGHYSRHCPSRRQCHNAQPNTLVHWSRATTSNLVSELSDLRARMEHIQQQQVAQARAATLLQPKAALPAMVGSARAGSLVPRDSRSATNQPLEPLNADLTMNTVLPPSDAMAVAAGTNYLMVNVSGMHTARSYDQSPQPDVRAWPQGEIDLDNRQRKLAKYDGRRCCCPPQEPGSPPRAETDFLPSELETCISLRTAEIPCKFGEIVTKARLDNSARFNAMAMGFAEALGLTVRQILSGRLVMHGVTRRHLTVAGYADSYVEAGGKRFWQRFLVFEDSVYNAKVCILGCDFWADAKPHLDYANSKCTINGVDIKMGSNLELAPNGSILTCGFWVNDLPVSPQCMFDGEHVSPPELSVSGTTIEKGQETTTQLAVTGTSSAVSLSMGKQIAPHESRSLPKNKPALWVGGEQSLARDIVTAEPVPVGGRTANFGANGDEIESSQTDYTVTDGAGGAIASNGAPKRSRRSRLRKSHSAGNSLHGSLQQRANAPPLVVTSSHSSPQMRACVSQLTSHKIALQQRQDALSKLATTGSSLPDTFRA